MANAGCVINGIAVACSGAAPWQTKRRLPAS